MMLTVGGYSSRNFVDFMAGGENRKVGKMPDRDVKTIKDLIFY